MKKVHIKDICTKGSSALKQKDLLENGDYPVYGASGIAGYLNEYHQDKEYIAVVKDGSGIGRVSFQEPQSSVIGTMQYILPKEGYNIRYIGYCLQSLDLAGYKQGAAIPHIYFRDYGERLVNVTDDKAEQQAIVSRLDTAFAKIDAVKANAEKQLNDAKTLFKKELSKAMMPKEGWERKEFGEVCSYHKEQGSYKDLPYIGMEHIESCTGRILATMDSNCVLSNTFKFNKGEVLYGRLRPYLKKIYVAEFDGCCSTEVFPIRTEKLEPGFVKYWFLTDEITDRINASAAGCRMPRGNMNDVKKYHIYFPKVQAEQQQIVDKLDTLSEKLKTVEEKQKAIMAECDAMKQALLREVFE